MLIVLAGIMVVAASFRVGPPIDVPALVALLLAAAGLLSVDLPGLRR